MSKSQRPVWLGEDQRMWDHIRVHLAVLEDPRIGVYELAVYCALVAHADTGTGMARPSNETLAKSRMSERRAREAVRVLEETGYIRTEEKAGHASHYFVLPVQTRPRHLVPPSDPPTPAPGAPHPGTSCRPGAPTPAPGAPELEVDLQNQRTTALESTVEPELDEAAVVVEELCRQLADAIGTFRDGARGGRPVVTDTWRRDMRLLLERGPLGTEPAPIPPERVGRCIAVVFEFLAEPDRGFCWAAQVGAPSGLRKHWWKLYEAAKGLGARSQHGRLAPVLKLNGADRPLDQVLEQHRQHALTAGDPR